MHVGLLRSEQPPDDETEIPALCTFPRAVACDNFCVELVQVTDDDTLKQHFTVTGFDSQRPLFHDFFFIQIIFFK